MVLTRQEKEKLIIDLYDQGKTYKEIAKEVRVSLRGIKPVLESAQKIRERELGIESHEGKESSSNNSQQQPSGQAYRLFAQGKTPLDVAAELSIREVEVTKYYREYWKLKKLHRLNHIYEDIKEDIIPIIRLYERMKAARIGIAEVTNLIKIANNDLPSVEHKYQRLKRLVNLLESRRLNVYRTFDQLQDQIVDSKRMLRSLRAVNQEQEDNINHLKYERIRIKRLVRKLKNEDEEYLKIKKTVQDEVSSVLLDGKTLLRLAFYSLIGSMRRDPEKYSALIHYANSNASYSGQYYTSYLGGEYSPQLDSYDSFSKALEFTILEDANNLYERLLIEQVNTIIANYGSNRNSSLLPIIKKSSGQPVDINKS